MIDYRKHIINNLPLKLRSEVMYALCHVLVSHIMTLQNEFKLWREKMLMKAGATPQTCMLEKIINDELGIIVEIVEGNGMSVDFIIKTDFTDIDKERQLFALLDRYKQAGRSYGYENARITIESIWTAHLCEMAEINNEWAKYICERTVKQKNIITTQPIGYGIDVQITSTYRVNEVMPIYFKIFGYDKTYRLDYTGSKVIFPSPESSVTGGAAPQFIWNSFVLGHAEDSEYQYELVIKK